MRGDHHPQLRRQRERFIKFRVLDPERALVGQEHFERGDPFLENNRPEIIRRRLIEARDAHVKGVVAGGYPSGLALPQGDRLARIVVAGGTAHFDQGRRAAHQRRPAAARIVIFRESPHERQVDMHMRIDETRKEVFAARIYHLRTLGRIDLPTDADDDPVLA